jgi:hypothetical protein
LGLPGGEIGAGRLQTVVELLILVLNGSQSLLEPSSLLAGAKIKQVAENGHGNAQQAQREDKGLFHGDEGKGPESGRRVS